jgi:hypothetical protein
MHFFKGHPSVSLINSSRLGAEQVSFNHHNPIPTRSTAPAPTPIPGPAPGPGPASTSVIEISTQPLSDSG